MGTCNYYTELPIKLEAWVLGQADAPLKKKNLYCNAEPHTTDSSCVDSSFSLTFSGTLDLCLSFPGSLEMRGLGLLMEALTSGSTASCFCKSLDTGGGFSGTVGWRPSIHNQCAEIILNQIIHHDPSLLISPRCNRMRYWYWWPVMLAD